MEDVDLKDSTPIEICGEEEAECCSSIGEFRYRVWEFCARWKYIICF